MESPSFRDAVNTEQGQELRPSDTAAFINGGEGLLPPGNISNLNGGVVTDGLANMNVIGCL